jgi:hypothetical protein
MRISIIIGLLLLFTFISCSDSKQKIQFKSEQFIINKDETTLGLDLSSDIDIAASLIIPVKPDSISKNKIVVLPFKSKNNFESNGFYSSQSTYNNSTIVSYNILNTSNLNHFIIKLFPIWKDEPSISDKSSLNWIQTGLNRQLHLKLKNEKSEDFRILYSISESISLIGIKLPTDSKVVEQRDENDNIIQSRIKDENRFFRVNELLENEIKLEYQVPPSKNQLKLVELLLKLIVLITVPIIQLIILKQDETKPFLRKITIIVGIITEIIAITLIIYFSIKNNSFSKVYDMIVLFIGIIFSGVVIYLGRNKNKANNV